MKHRTAFSAGALAARRPSPVVALALCFCATLSSRSSAQGGWRQWDIQLRDGSRVEANPLGAPDNMHISRSVGGYEGHDSSTIARSRIDYIAAQASTGPALPPAPTRRVCTDVVVRRDGRKTTGRVTLTRIMYSEGVIRQRGVDIDLKDVAYVKFASSATSCARHATPEGLLVSADTRRLAPDMDYDSPDSRIGVRPQ